MATKVKKTKQANYVFAVGRRKSAVARVRLYKKKGELTVNDQPIDQYFPGTVNRFYYQRPLKLVESLGKYSATIKVVGGGANSQLEAVVHGLARAFNALDREKYRPILKKHGLLTRDPRVRERRKAGTGGKARRQKQSPKR